jgi:murein DD-endopeptidase MepM/ murein hydrolase activator NlpD
MRSKPRLVPSIILATFIGFVAGVTLMAAVFARATRMSAAGRPADDCGPSTFVAPPDDVAAPLGPMAPAPVREPVGALPDPPAPVPSAVPELGIDPLADLKKRDLRVPVRGVDADDLTRSFADTRSGNRLHEAIDILAPRNTPVLAVEDGVLVKFFHSKAGGNTIYQFDPASRYAYYYAHLDRYAPGVKEGDRVKKGQIIGHVGTTGNAPPNTPHLHFAIFRLTEKKQWWKGTPIDPFDVWR